MKILASMLIFVFVSCDRDDSVSDKSNDFLPDLKSRITNESIITKKELLDYFSDQSVSLEEVDGGSEMGVSYYSYFFSKSGVDYTLSIIEEDDNPNVKSNSKLAGIRVYRGQEVGSEVLLLNLEMNR